MTVALVPVLLLLTGLAGSWVLTGSVRRDSSTRVEDASRVVSREHTAGLAVELQQYTQTASFLAAAVGSSPTLDSATFQALALSGTALPGVASISYLVPVRNTPVDVAAAQQRLREQMGTPLTLTPVRATDPTTASGAGSTEATTDLDAGPLRAGEGEEHLFVAASYTRGSVDVLVGRDAAEVPALVHAAEQARNSGRVAVSAAFTMPADRALPAPQRPPSVAFLAPVRSSHLQQDRGAFRGWVVISARVGAVLSAASGAVPAARLELQDITDVADRGGAATGGGGAVRSDPVAGPASPVPTLASVAARELLPTRFEQQETLMVGDRQWRLWTRPQLDATTEQVLQRPRRVLTAAIAASVLMAGFVFLVLHGRERARRRTGQITGSLAAEVQARRTSELALRTREAEATGYSALVATRLRSPLQRLAGLADETRRAGRGAVESKRLDDLISEVDVQVDRSQRLVEDLLLYARTSELAVQRAAVDLMVIARALCDLQEAKTSHLPLDLQPRFEVDPLPEMLGEAGLLQELLLRLIDNAVVHAPPGRAARVRVSAELAGTRNRGDHWRISVSDRGSGVPAARRAGIFQPLSDHGSSAGADRDDSTGSGSVASSAPGAAGASRSVGGAGAGDGVGNHLSLAICRRIVHRMGGAIGVEDNAGGGAVFWFTVPVHQEDVARLAPPPRETAPVPRAERAGVLVR